MARPTKLGLDYFPFDINFFEDEKIFGISALYGIKGEVITIRLLCEIYRNGYYIQYTELLNNKLAKLSGIKPNIANEIVTKLVGFDFFDKDTFSKHNILTSRGIQKRFEEAVSRRKNIINDKYWLLGVDDIDINDDIYSTEVHLSGVIDDINTDSTVVNDNISTQSKVNKIKENINKEEIKKEEKKKFSFDFSNFDENFIEHVNSWLEYKKERKEPYKSQKGLNAFYNKLIDFSKNDPDTAKKIIEQSMANNWAGIFELKESQQKNKDTFYKEPIVDRTHGFSMQF